MLHNILLSQMGLTVLWLLLSRLTNTLALSEKQQFNATSIEPLPKCNELWHLIKSCIYK